MNIPNKLTVSRLFLAPIFFVLYFLPNWTGMNAPALTWLLLLVYVLIEISDLLDGFIARRYQMVTDLGKVLDPFSDVISRMTYFVCLAFSGIMPLWVFLIILYRELSVTFLRMILMGKGWPWQHRSGEIEGGPLCRICHPGDPLYRSSPADRRCLLAGTLCFGPLVGLRSGSSGIDRFFSLVSQRAKTHLADMSS